MGNYKLYTIDELKALRTYSREDNSKSLVEVTGFLRNFYSFSRKKIMQVCLCERKGPYITIEGPTWDRELISMAYKFAQSGKEVIVQGRYQSFYGHIWAHQIIPAGRGQLSLTDRLEGGELSLTNEGALTIVKEEE